MTGRLRLEPPFDFDLSCRAAGMECFRAALHLDGAAIAVEVRSAGRVEEPVVAWTAAAPARFREPIATAVAWMMGAELHAFYAAMQPHPRLRALIQQLRGLRMLRTPTLHEALVAAVLEQQVGAATARRLHAAWTTGDRAALPARKARILQALERPGINWSVAELAAMNGEAAIECLLVLDGVGRWTAAWALLRGLGHPDALPAGDAAIRAAAGAFFACRAPLTPRALERQLRPFAPWRGWAASYILAGAGRTHP